MLCSTTRIVLPCRLRSRMRSARCVMSVGIHTTGRLVEEQDGRVSDQQRGQLEQLALAVGQVAGRFVSEAGDPHEIQKLHGTAPFAHRAGQAHHAAQPALLALGRDQHVLQHGQAREQTGQLERATDAEPEHPVGRCVGDLGALEVHLTVLDALVAGDHVEQGRLARPIGADQAVDLTLVDLEVTQRQGGDTSVGLGDALDLDQIAHCAAPATPPGTLASRSADALSAALTRRRSSNALTPGTTPRGMMRMTTRNSTP